MCLEDQVVHAYMYMYHMTANGISVPTYDYIHVRCVHSVLLKQTQAWNKGDRFTHNVYTAHGTTLPVL